MLGLCHCCMYLRCTLPAKTGISMRQGAPTWSLLKPAARQASTRPQRSRLTRARAGSRCAQKLTGMYEAGRARCLQRLTAACARAAHQRPAHGPAAARAGGAGLRRGRVQLQPVPGHV